MCGPHPTESWRAARSAHSAGCTSGLRWNMLPAYAPRRRRSPLRLRGGRIRGESRPPQLPPRRSGMRPAAATRLYSQIQESVSRYCPSTCGLTELSIVRGRRAWICCHRRFPAKCVDFSLITGCYRFVRAATQCTAQPGRGRRTALPAANSDSGGAA